MIWGISIEIDISEISLLGLFLTFTIIFAEKKFSELYFACVIIPTYRNHLDKVFWILF